MSWNENFDLKLTYSVHKAETPEITKINNVICLARAKALPVRSTIAEMNGKSIAKKALEKRKKQEQEEEQMQEEEVNLEANKWKKSIKYKHKMCTECLRKGISEKETHEHILLECSAYNKWRQKKITTIKNLIENTLKRKVDENDIRWWFHYYKNEENLAKEELEFRYLLATGMVPIEYRTFLKEINDDMDFKNKSELMENITEILKKCTYEIFMERNNRHADFWEEKEIQGLEFKVKQLNKEITKRFKKHCIKEEESRVRKKENRGKRKRKDKDSTEIFCQSQKMIKKRKIMLQRKERENRRERRSKIREKENSVKKRKNLSSEKLDVSKKKRKIKNIEKQKIIGKNSILISLKKGSMEVTVTEKTNGKEREEDEIDEGIELSKRHASSLGEELDPELLRFRKELREKSSKKN